MSPLEHYIDGRFAAPHSPRLLDVIDPATQEVIGQVSDGDAGDVNAAVAAARRAFDTGPWPAVTGQERGRILFRLAQIIRDHAPELAERDTRNTGKPSGEAEFDIADAATRFEHYGGTACQL